VSAEVVPEGIAAAMNQDGASASKELA